MIASLHVFSRPGVCWSLRAHPTPHPHPAVAELLSNVVKKSYATAGISEAASWEATEHASYI